MLLMGKHTPSVCFSVSSSCKCCHASASWHNTKKARLQIFKHRLFELSEYHE